MLEVLKGHLNEEQVKIIIDTMINQYELFLKETQSASYQKLFRKEYAPHNKQHSVSWAIASAFPSGNTIAGDLKVSCIKYSGGYTRPEIGNDWIVIHVLNHTTHFNSSYLKEYYQYNKGFNGKRLYCYLKFYVENRKLSKVVLCVPDENGMVVESEVLINKSDLKLLSA